MDVIYLLYIFDLLKYLCKYSANVMFYKACDHSSFNTPWFNTRNFQFCVTSEESFIIHKDLKININRGISTSLLPSMSDWRVLACIGTFSRLGLFCISSTASCFRITCLYPRVVSPITTTFLKITIPCRDQKIQIKCHWVQGLTGDYGKVTWHFGFVYNLILNGSQISSFQSTYGKLLSVINVWFLHYWIRLPELMLYARRCIPTVPW